MTVKNPHEPASEAQLRLIDRLLVRLSDQDTLEGPSPRSCAYKRLSDGLTKGTASQWIEKLSALPAPEPEGDLKIVVDHLRSQRAEGKINDFGASLLSQFEARGTLSEKQVACVLKRVQSKTNSDPVPLVPAGRYAVELDGEVVLVRVWRGTRNPNVQQVYSIVSHEDEGDRLHTADEGKVAREIAKDPEAAAREFGRRTGHCYRCGCKLEVNLSRSMSVGPECAKHVMTRERRLSLMAEHRKQLRDAGLDPSAKFDDLALVA